MTLEYTVKDTDNNQTINQIIQREFNLSSRLFNKLLHNKKILLNDTNVDTRNFANCGDTLSIDLNYEEDNSNIIPTKMNLNILYEDDTMLILNKPAGIPVHPSMLHYENSLSNGVKFYFDSIGLHKKIRPVNRLDLNTSGIMIFAKNEYIQENLIRQMANGTFKKEYLAIAVGHFNIKHGIINAPIARKEKSIIERCVSESGQKAITEYEVIKEFYVDTQQYINNQLNSNNKLNSDEMPPDNSKTLSLVKCHLLTGRTHQIRVHMAYIGHPLLGDTMYGKPSELIDRQALHSSKISFIHPITKEHFKLCCALPSDMKIL